MSDENTYGIFLRNLIAKDNYNLTNNFTLIDSKGFVLCKCTWIITQFGLPCRCPVEMKMMREVRTVGLSSKSLESYLEAFIFTGGSLLVIEAEVETCLDKCKPVRHYSDWDKPHWQVVSFGRFNVKLQLVEVKMIWKLWLRMEDEDGVLLSRILNRQRKVMYFRWRCCPSHCWLGHATERQPPKNFQITQFPPPTSPSHQQKRRKAQYLPPSVAQRMPNRKSILAGKQSSPKVNRSFSMNDKKLHLIPPCHIWRWRSLTKTMFVLNISICLLLAWWLSAYKASSSLYCSTS